MVFVTKTWRDHYHTDTVIPWPFSLVLLIAVGFGVSQLLRFLHNVTNKRVTDKIARYYKESTDFEFPSVEQAVAFLAKVEAKFYRDGDDVYIPNNIIQLLGERYGCKKSEFHTLYEVYFQKYLVNIEKKIIKKFVKYFGFACNFIANPQHFFLYDFFDFF